MTYQLDINDFIGTWCFSKQYVKNQLSGYKGKPVNVRISSLGGSVEHGLDIRQQFIDHGDVTAYLYGMVASSATIVATGAKKVCISKYCMFLVHKVSNWVDAWGSMNADQIAELIEQLKANKLENDKFDLVLANMYADKCKKKVSEILDILKEGRWMTAQEAKDYGFVDEIIEGDESKIDYAAFSSKLNVMGLTPLPENLVHPTDKNLFDKVVKNLTAYVDSKFNKQQEEIDEVKVIDMKKDYVKVNTLLDVEGFEVDKENKTTLTEEQIKTINDKLDSLEKENKEKEDALAAAQSDVKKKDDEIKVMKDAAAAQDKLPGAQTTNIEGDGDDDKNDESPFSKANEMFNSVKDII